MKVTVMDEKYRVKELRERVKEFEESESEILEINLSEDELNDISLSIIDYLVSAMVNSSKIDVKTIRRKNSVFLFLIKK